MAAAKKQNSVEEKLKRLIAEEIERRRKFSENLQELQKERNEMGAGAEQPTVEQLLEKMDSADAIINAQMKDLCLELPPVSLRDKVPQDSSQDRDSGIPPSPASSADMDSARRQAVLLRHSAVPVENTDSVGLPELLTAPSLPTHYSAMHVERTDGGPTEHSDLPDSPHTDSVKL
ncbi:uncharacterized protein LOC143291984 [Babylonia areolata]|uniref:uncharacterized protein LOC143291984 n=1 Tax=Babylonia areolata TaxID=304850 RepID=UPI003FCF7F94